MSGNKAGGLSELYGWPEGENIVKNPGFAEKDATGMPVAWGLNRPPAVTVVEEGLQFQDTHLQKTTPSAIQSLTEAAPGWYTLRARAKAIAVGTNNTSAYGRVAVLNNDGTRGQTDGIRDTADWKVLDRTAFPIPETGAKQLRVETYQKPDGTLLFTDLELRKQMPALVEGFLLYPNYRGMLFEDRSQAVRMVVMMSPPAGLALSFFRVRLLLETESGTPIASREVIPEANTFEITVDATLAPLGAHRLRLQVFAVDSRFFFEYPPHVIVKRAAADRSGMSCYIDPDNVMVLYGQRAFAFGIYDTSGFSLTEGFWEKQLARIFTAPFNLYLNYWLGNTSSAVLKVLMNVLQRRGMAFLHTANTMYADGIRWEGGVQCEGQTADTLGEAAYTACRARDLGAHPGCAGYYTMDERTADKAARVFGQYAILREHDQDGVCFIVSNKPHELTRWRDACDVIGEDSYPVRNARTSPGANRLEQVAEWTDAAREASYGARPVWGVIQYHPATKAGGWPTYEELRSMSFLAIVAGAKGLFYWSHGAMGLAWVSATETQTEAERKAEIWDRLVRILTELKAIEPVLIAPDALDVLDSAPVRTLTKRVSGKRYIIAVNETAEPVTGSFLLRESASVVNGLVLGGSLPLVLDGQSFTDSFLPYGAHVYEVE